jgi:hypothetical protein
MTTSQHERLSRVNKRRESLTEMALLDEAIDPGDIRGSYLALDVDRKRAVIKRLCSGIVVPPMGKGGKRNPTGYGVKILWNKRQPDQG